jgi:hypothetical protein
MIPPGLSFEELSRRFGSPPNPVYVNDGPLPPIDVLRWKALNLGAELVLLCPPGRELSTAVTKLEEAVMWAAKAIDTA